MYRRPLLLALAAGLALSLPLAAEPLAVRDQNPLTRGAYLPLPGHEAAVGVPVEVGAALQWSNTVNLGSSARERMVVDEETMEFDLGVAADRGGWRLRALLPVIHRGAGALDGVIDGWHRLFGLPQGDRPKRPRGAFAISYQRDGVGVIDARPGTALGDLALEAGHVLVAGPRGELSGWIGLEAPTGRRADLTGDGRLDLAGWLSGRIALGDRGELTVRAGIARSGGSTPLPLRRRVGFGTLAAGWYATPRLEALVQLDGHSALADGSDLPFLKGAIALAFGARYRLAGGARLEAGVVEDIQVDHSPDVTFQFGWRRGVGTAR